MPPVAMSSKRASPARRGSPAASADGRAGGLRGAGPLGAAAGARRGGDEGWGGAAGQAVVADVADYLPVVLAGVGVGQVGGEGGVDVEGPFGVEGVVDGRVGIGRPHGEL